MAYDGDGEYLPGEWCTFCKVSVKCRARAEEKMKLARLEFKMPPLLTDAEIEEVLDVLPDLTKWANEITAYATEAAIHHGKEWNGFKVVAIVYASFFKYIKLPDEVIKSTLLQIF